MTAVIGPVGVDHADFGDGGIPIFGAEILLAELNVIQIHGETLLVDEFLERLAAELVKTFQCLDGLRQVHLHFQGLREIHGGKACFHRIDDIVLDFTELLVRDAAAEEIDLCGADVRALTLCHELNTLGGTGSALIKLAGKIFHSKEYVILPCHLFRGDVQLGLREDGLAGVIKRLFRKTLHVVAIQDADTGDPFNTQQVLDVVGQGLRLIGELRFLLYKNSIYHLHGPPSGFSSVLPVLCGRYLYGNTHCQSEWSSQPHRPCRWPPEGCPPCG